MLTSIENLLRKPSRRVEHRVRSGRSPAAATLFVVIVLCLAWNWVDGAPPTWGPETSRLEDTTGKGRLREGADFADRVGIFRITGDRITFFTDEGRTRMICLENLVLDRISRKISESALQLDWQVAGTITEFHDANYFLVEHATLDQSAGRSKGAASGQ